jgi:N-formylglutamate deformylase
METFSLHRGTLPLLVSLPHNGSFIPVDIGDRMHPQALASPDTDWHVDLLYEGAVALGASVLKPLASRYVVDLNRPADGHALYPGQRETGLVPTVMFSGDAIYRDGQSPDADDIAGRISLWWQPYHDALAAELQRLLSAHGRVVLWEGHSIRSEVPMLFEGRLPDFNLGTAQGASCSPELQSRLEAVLHGQCTFSHVINGRFKGGFITRHYGQPGTGVHAVQLELAQINYMDEDSFAYLADRAQAVRQLIDRLLVCCCRFDDDAQSQELA